MGNVLSVSMLVVAILTVPNESHAFDFFRSPTAVALDEAQKARKMGDLELAKTLLDQIDPENSKPSDARVLHERGLWFIDSGQGEDAIKTLRHAADLNPSSDARLDLGGLLITLGRWPEAVLTMKRVFAERGATLAVERVLRDHRFRPLATFEPYKKLIAEIRLEQQGTIGKLRARLEGIESSARQLGHTLDELATWVTTIGRLLSTPWIPAIILLLIVFTVSSGIHQMHVLKPPWTLIFSYTICSSLWTMAVGIASFGKSKGYMTIGITGGLILGPMLGHWIIRKMYTTHGRKKNQVS